MKINRLEHTKSLYPHFFDKTDESNFTKHLKIVGKPQQHIRHKLKTIEWSRILEKPLQIWKTQTEPYIYDMHFKVLVPNLKKVTVYKNPVISDDEEVIGYESTPIQEEFDYEDHVRFFERTLDSLETKEYSFGHEEEVMDVWDEDNNISESFNPFVLGEVVITDPYIISTETFPVNSEVMFTLRTYDADFTLKVQDEDGADIVERTYPLLSETNHDFNINITDTKITINLNGVSTDDISNLSINKDVKIKLCFNPTQQSMNFVVTNKLVTTERDITHQRIIPNDTFLLEVYTWDDYHFLKGFPENDYTVKEDNILQYRYNETFLSIKLEEISYSKYLTFKVHKDNIKEILIRKNEKPLFKQEFIIDLITNKPSTDFSYTYFDNDTTNEYTYNKLEYSNHYEIEDSEANYTKVYFAEQENDEYVFRLLLTDDDFMDGVVKDVYDLEVTTYEKRYHCLHEYDRVYSKRYNGYDTQLNDCFDHDYSLDIIGTLLNVPRLRFYQVYKNNKYYLSRTYPTYNNRATEDDYHYMKRIQYYISNYNHIVFPVLEFWKWYQTDATIRSRRHILAEMDYSHFRTLQSDDDVCGTDFIDDEFDTEQIISYSVNKATITQGELKEENIITRGTKSWYEAIIVDRVYVVPNVDYRFRYGVKDNSENVNIRLICYDRGGTVIRTTNVENVEYSVDAPLIEGIWEEHQYSTDNDYNYVDTKITIPSDTVSVQVILESDGIFSFKDVTFERITVNNFDNGFIVTDTDYNSNVYELYAVYEDIPSNIRIGGSERFDILFKRSLPLTKRGFVYMDINQKTTTTLNANTGLKLYVSNILPTGLRSGETNYEATIIDFVEPSAHYVLEFCVDNADENIDVDDLNSSFLTTTTITYYDSEGSDTVEEFADRIYADSPTRIRYDFVTPLDTVKFKININNTVDSVLTNIALKRVEELSDGEVY